MKAQTSLRGQRPNQSTSGGAAPTGRHSITQGFIPVPATRALRHVIARNEATDRDASLSGCGVTRGAYRSAGRYSLPGMSPAPRHCEAKQSNPFTSPPCPLSLRRGGDGAAHRQRMTAQGFPLLLERAGGEAKNRKSNI